MTCCQVHLSHLTIVEAPSFSLSSGSFPLRIISECADLRRDTCKMLLLAFTTITSNKPFTVQIPTRPRHGGISPRRGVRLTLDKQFTRQTERGGWGGAVWRLVEEVVSIREGILIFLNQINTYIHT